MTQTVEPIEIRWISDGEEVSYEHDGPLDVFIQNEGSSEWIFAGQTTPYKTKHPDGRSKGQHIPNYQHLLTGNAHKFRMKKPSLL